MAPEVLERILEKVRPAASAHAHLESRVLAGRAHNEDAALVAIPSGAALVQTVDILTPIVNDAYMFGRIAAANALSDVYAMGGTPWCAMNMLFFPTACHGLVGEDVVAQILQGGLDALIEAEAVLVGGHTVEDNEIKYGLSVTGIIDPAKKATNDGLQAGDTLLLTKPLGTGILSTGVKARWDDFEESEALITKWCSKLNKGAGKVLTQCSLKAATDITGFGLGGHVIEMARASKVQVVLHCEALPAMAHVIDYAKNGLIPAGSHANRKFWQAFTHVPHKIDINLESLVFDTQTSGGLLLAVPAHKVDEVKKKLFEEGDEAWEVGFVQALSENTAWQQKPLVLL